MDYKQSKVAAIRTITQNRDLVFVIVLSLLHSVLLVYAACCNSPAGDEVVSLPSGIIHWKTGKLNMSAVNPPLVRMIAAIPVLILNPIVDSRYSNADPRLRYDFQLGPRFIRQNVARIREYFILARFACIPFSLLAMWICYWWAREVFGGNSGNLAAFFWCLSPMVLGHASLITADVGASALGAAAIFRLRAWLLSNSLFDAIYLGIVSGLALLTKFVFFPIFPAICLIMVPLWRFETNTKLTLRDVAHVFLAAFTCIFVVNLFYSFEGTFTPLSGISLDNDKTRTSSHLLSTGAFSDRRRPTLVDSLPVPLPLVYVQGMDQVARELDPTADKSQSYLMGTWKEGGWWYYYIIGVLVKEPLPIILSGIIVCFSVARRYCGHRGLGQSKIAWHEIAILLVPALLIFVFVSSLTGFNRHLRYILPAYPFAYILCSMIALLISRSFLLFLLTWLTTGTFWSSPYWLSSFNEAAGGPRNGAYWLLGSNVDWSQDLYRLQAWIRAHPEAKGIKSELYNDHATTIVGIADDPPPPFAYSEHYMVDSEKKRGPQPGWYAISIRSMKKKNSEFSYFERFQPIGQAGYSIYIFNITSKEADRVRKELELEESRLSQAKLLPYFPSSKD